MFEVDWQALIFEEIANKRIYRKSVAQTYRYLMESSRMKPGAVDWLKVNRAIIERWSVSGLNWIKHQAWSGKCLPAAD